jgi:APA family basic amino acid/polyamine antiporter
MPELRKAIKLPQATSLVVGIIIGASIFVQPSEITGLVRSTEGTIIVWLCSGILTMFGALICAELSTIFPKTGGVYVYLKECFSRPVGFLWGWAMFWSMHSGIIAAIAVIFARYTGYFVPLSEAALRAVAIGVILVHSIINFYGVKYGSNLQYFITMGKVLAILLIIVVGSVLGAGLPVHFDAGSFVGAELSFDAILKAMVAGLFAFGGWHMVTYNAEETVEPEKTIPRSLVIGTLTVTFCYVALNTVYMYILPLDQVASSTRVAADAASVVLGPGAGAFVSGLVMFSTFGAVGGIVLTGPRVYYSMAKDGLLFKWVGDLHPRFGTPHKAIILQAIWSSVLVATGTYRELFTRVIYTEWIFFGLMAIGLLVLQRRGVRKGKGIVIPTIFSLSSFAIVINHFAAQPLQAVSGLSLLAAGYVIYYVVLRKPPS